MAFIENNKAIIFGVYSNTTLRHIKEFLRQNGFKAESKQQILRDYLKGIRHKDKPKEFGDFMNYVLLKGKCEFSLLDLYNFQDYWENLKTNNANLKEFKEFLKDLEFVKDLKENE